jgi:hypothetical protein
MAQEDKLFTDKLEGVKNWQVWKYQMQVILEARELWGYVDGTATSPALSESSSSSSSAQTVFEKAQKKTKALLVTSINSELWGHVESHIESCGVTLMERQPARLYQKAVHQVHRLKQFSKRLRRRPKLYLLRV